MDAFDYVIVGAGAAGCVLANRLSNDSANTVLLLEAGGRDLHPYIHMPKGLAKIMADPRYTWPYSTSPSPCTGGAAEPWIRGRTLGGSSSINGMMYVRGQAADYDRLAELTSEDWSWRRIGAAYKALENHQLGAAETRGDGGPLRISMPTARDPITDAAIEAGVALGLQRKADVNDPADVERIGYAPRTIYRGRRQSAAVAFLNPIRGRANLKVVTGFAADKLLLAGARAVGISGSRAGSPVTYRAKREVLLCAGSMGSPAILQRSGIGPAGHLRQLGIAVVHDSPGVGANLREHRALILQWRTADRLSQNRQYRGGRTTCRAAGRWRPGPTRPAPGSRPETTPTGPTPSS